MHIWQESQDRITFWLTLMYHFLMAQQHSPKPKSKTTYVSEPRRSTRARNPVPSYRDDVSNHIGAEDGRTKGEIWFYNVKDILIFG